MNFDLLHRTLRSWQRPESACINNCNCYTASVSPVCGSNGITYLSACFAGCTKPVSEAVNASEMTTMDKGKLLHTFLRANTHIYTHSASVLVYIFFNTIFISFLVFVSEPDQLLVYIQHQWGGGGFTGEVSQSRLSAGVPHLPVCDLCVQHDRSYGPDALCHHLNQVKTYCYTHTAHKREP